MTDASQSQEPAGIGHNSPPPDKGTYEWIRPRAQALIDTCNKWLRERPEIQTDGQAQAAKDFQDQLNALIRMGADARKAELDPLDREIRQVRRKFDDMMTPVKKALDLFRPKMTAWLQKKEAERLAEEKRIKEEAEALQRKADEKLEEFNELYRQAQDGELQGTEVDIIAASEEDRKARRDAKEGRDQHKRVSKTKTKARGSYGQRSTALRQHHSGTITDYKKALKHYSDSQLVESAVEQAMRADIRANGPAIRDGTFSIPGVQIKTESAAV